MDYDTALIQVLRRVADVLRDAPGAALKDCEVSPECDSLIATIEFTSGHMTGFEFMDDDPVQCERRLTTAIARACEENVMSMALSADSRPHFTTIASFISTMGEGAARLFRDVLLVVDEQGRIGREILAVDGVKLLSNAT